MGKQCASNSVVAADDFLVDFLFDSASKQRGVPLLAEAAERLFKDGAVCCPRTKMHQLHAHFSKRVRDFLTPTPTAHNAQLLSPGSPLLY